MGNGNFQDPIPACAGMTLHHQVVPATPSLREGDFILCTLHFIIYNYE